MIWALPTEEWKEKGRGRNRDGKESQGKHWRVRFTSVADGRGMRATEAAIPAATGSNSPYTFALLEQQHYAYFFQIHSTKKPGQTRLFSHLWKSVYVTAYNDNVYN